MTTLSQQGFEATHKDQRQLWLKASSQDQQGKLLLVKSQAAQTLNTIITILAVYKTMYENASKITLNAMCRK